MSITGLVVCSNLLVSFVFEDFRLVSARRVAMKTAPIIDITTATEMYISCCFLFLVMLSPS